MKKLDRIKISFLISIILALIPACANNDDDSADSTLNCSGLGGQPGFYELDIESATGTRAYRLTVPDQYDSTVGAPVVLNFHGWTSSSAQQDAMSAMPEKAQQEGFILLTPQGYKDPASWNGGLCCPPANQETDDVAYARRLVDRLEEDYCVDRSRIYATGMSNGGFMSNRLGCEASDLIAAIAPVSSVLGVSDCNPANPVPIMMFNGNADSLVTYNGEDPLLEGLPDVPGSFNKWAEINECEGSTEVTFTNGEVTCESYANCKAETTLCTIDGGGHTWPGSPVDPVFGHRTLDINATDAMWEFFADKRRK